MQLMMPVSISSLSPYRRTTLTSVSNLHFSENQVFDKQDCVLLTVFREVLKIERRVLWFTVAFMVFSKFPHYWVNLKHYIQVNVNKAELNAERQKGKFL